jgi:serine/threonine protein kinase
MSTTVDPSSDQSGQPSSIERELARYCSGFPIFPGYMPTSFVGRGGQAEVYKGIRGSDGAVVAIKVPRRDIRCSTDRLTREAEVLQLLRTRHARGSPTFCEFRPDEDPPFLVIEFVEGVSLRRHISSRDSANETGLRLRVRLAAKIARVLHSLHANFVFHRDVKPENILVRTPSSEPVLIDYGIAQLPNCEPLTTAGGTSPHTRNYRAPELRLSGAAANAKSDTYSFGVVLFQLLTGLPAKGEPDANWDTNLYGESDFRTMPRVSGARRIKRLCLRCLEFESSLRPDLEVVASELEAAMFERKSPYRVPLAAMGIVLFCFFALAIWMYTIHREVQQTRLAAPQILKVITSSDKWQHGWANKQSKAPPKIEPDEWYDLPGFEKGTSFEFAQPGSLFVTIHVGQMQWKGDAKSGAQIKLRILLDDVEVAKSHCDVGAWIVGTDPNLLSSGSKQMSVVWAGSQVDARRHVLKVQWQITVEGSGDLYVSEVQSARTLIVTYFPTSS